MTYYPSLITEFDDPTLIERVLTQLVKVNNHKFRLLCFALIIWTAVPETSEARFRCRGRFRPFQRMRCNRQFRQCHRPMRQRVVRRCQPCVTYRSYPVQQTQVYQTPVIVAQPPQVIQQPQTEQLPIQEAPQTPPPAELE